MKKYTYILWAVPIFLAGALSGCSSHDAEEPVAATSSSRYVLMGIDGDAGASAWLAVSGSRAGEDLAVDAPETIGIWGVNNYSVVNQNLVFDNQKMYYRLGDEIKAAINVGVFSEAYVNEWVSGNYWVYTPKKSWIFDTHPNYKFLAYAPYLKEERVSVDNDTYEGIEKLTLKNIPRCGAEDYMVSSMIKTYTVQNSTSQEVQTMYMRHLTSRLRFQFKLGDRYSALRKIRIRELMVANADGEMFTVTVDYPYNSATNSYGLNSITWTAETAGSTETTVTPEFTGDYLELTKDNAEYQIFGSAYVYPGKAMSRLVIAVVYDVYDLEGQLLRKEDTATNTLWLGFSASGTVGDVTRVLEAGYYYDIKIPIEPSYLYVLSDNDPIDYLVLPE